MRVLIVDDSRAMQQIIKRSLLNLNHSELDIAFASSGEEALELAKKWQPELALLDWHMPGMNGLELLFQLAFEKIKVKAGFITTETAPDKIKEAMDAARVPWTPGRGVQSDARQ